MSDAAMNPSIRRLGSALMVCFVVLFAQLNYVQVFRADDLNERPDNRRTVVRTFARPRGTISTADGVLLARSVETDSDLKFARQYPEGELFGQVTGYYNFNFGATGLERSYNEDLAGESAELDFQSVSDLFIEQGDVGNLTLTIRKDVQEVARDQLGDRPGSVVAVDPRSGNILAFWSFPTFDPNPLSSTDLEASQDVFDVLKAAPGNPLLPKTYRETYFPGSTFKVVTGSNGLDSGRVTPNNPSYPVQRSYDIDFTTNELDNFGGNACGGTLFEILRISCNTAFAEMGADTVGPQLMVQGAEEFGFNRRPPIDLPAAAASRFPTEFPDNQGNGPLARASIGQGDVSSTPLQMALVAAAIANGGVVMRPHLLTDVRDEANQVVRRYQPEPWTTATSPGTATTMRQAMIGVVADGTATGLQIPGQEVGGKTGTAQLGTDPPRSHAWIIGFAGPPGGAPEVAVAVIVEGQPGASEQTGGRIAAPIARAVMERILLVNRGQAPGGGG